MERTWHSYEDRQGAYATTMIRDRAKVAGFETDYSRIGWTTMVAVRCTPSEWTEIIATVKQEG